MGKPWGPNLNALRGSTPQVCLPAIGLEGVADVPVGGAKALLGVWARYSAVAAKWVYREDDRLRLVGDNGSYEVQEERRVMNPGKVILKGGWHKVRAKKPKPRS